MTLIGSGPSTAGRDGPVRLRLPEQQPDHVTVITGSPAMRYAAMTSFPATAIGRCSGDTIALVFGVGQRRSSSRDAGAGHAVAVISDATGQLLTGLSITAGGTSGVS